MNEYKSFYTKSKNDKNTKEILTPFSGYTFNGGVSCKNCKYFKIDYDDWGDREMCRHKENTGYAYNHTGKCRYFLWDPKTKNKLSNCELWEEKKNIFQKIKIKLGVN